MNQNNHVRLFYGKLSCASYYGTFIQYKSRYPSRTWRRARPYRLNSWATSILCGFLGFPISMVFGGLIYHKVGGQKIMQFAFLAHAIGIIMTIYSGKLCWITHFDITNRSWKWMY